MITYAILAKIAKNGPAVTTWARQITELVAKKTGVTSNALTRLGGPMDILFVSQYEDLAAFEKGQAALLTDPDYIKLIESAQSQGLFVPGSIDTAFWRPV